jgi:hypothetical protein
MRQVRKAARIAAKTYIAQSKNRLHEAIQRDPHPAVGRRLAATATNYNPTVPDSQHTASYQR